jgi:hypothetical protein
VVQVAPPEIELAVTVAATWLVYQPLWSGGRASATATVGPEVSYLKVALPELVSPALSVQVPDMVASALSGPE